jgi:hypothetical protein
MIEMTEKQGIIAARISKAISSAGPGLTNATRAGPGTDGIRRRLTATFCFPKYRGILQE